MCRLLCLLACLAAPLFAAAPPVPPDRQTRKDSESVARGGLSARSADLLADLCRSAKVASDPKQLLALVEQLADEESPVRSRAERTLRLCAPAAEKLLREAADGNDAERRRRARRCLRVIDSGDRRAAFRAAMRLLETYPPEGHVAGIAEVAAAERDEELREEFLLLLVRWCASLPGERHPLLASLKDESPTRRAAAAFVLGRTAAESRKVVRPLLKDRDDAARFEAAWALACAGEREAVPVLATLCGSKDAAVAAKARRVLGRIAFDTNTAGELKARDPRKASADEWAAWWKLAEKKADLSSPWLSLLPPREALVYSDLDDDCLIFCAGDGESRWRIEGVRGVVDLALMPGREMLLTENHVGRVTLRHGDGKIIGQIKTVRLPVSAGPLAGGGVWVATEDSLVEYDRNGRAGKKIELSGARFALRVASKDCYAVTDHDGSLLFPGVEGQRWVEDPGASEAWVSAAKDASGGFLVSRRRGVFAFSTGGKLVGQWEVAGATSAARRESGNLVVATSEKRLLEIDKAGKVVWERKTLGRPWHVQVIP